MSGVCCWDKDEILKDQYRNSEAIIGESVWSLEYRKISNISRTKSENLHISRLGLQLSLHDIHVFKASVKLRMKMQLEQQRQAMLQLYLSVQQYDCLLKCVLY